MAKRIDEGHELTEKQLAALEKRIAKVYKQAGKELQGTIDAYFEKFKERDEEMKALIGTEVNGKEWTEQDYKHWRLNQMARGERYQALREKVAQRMTAANEVAVSYTNDATPGIYSLNRNYAAYTIEQVSPNADFTLWDEQTVKRLIVEEPDLMPYYPKARAVKRGIDLAYGKKQITASVTSAILQGKSIKGIADDLQDRITTMSRAGAIRTARTAVTGAQNAGRMDSYGAAEKMGIQLKKEWLATLDARTRHSHAMLDGEQVAQDKKFSNGCRFPGDPQGPAWEIYNCRCTLIAAVEGVDTSDALRRDRDGLLPDMTFAQWEASKRGYSATPVSKIRDEPVKEWRNALQNNENRAILKSKIESGEISTKIRPQVQARHIEGTPQFEEYKARRLAKGQTPQSILTVTGEETQKLVDKYHCTGEVVVKIRKDGSFEIKEYTDTDVIAGKYYAENAYHDTRRTIIFYSKKGTHIVPTKPEGKK